MNNNEWVYQVDQDAYCEPLDEDDLNTSSEQESLAHAQQTEILDINPSSGIAKRVRIES